MNILYLDCGMGAAGDMLAGALLELMPEPESVLAELNGAGIPGVTFTREDRVKCGIRGTHFSVLVHGQEEGEEHHGHHHSHMEDIGLLVRKLALPEAVKEQVLAVYRRIAGAESKVHGVPVSEIHFHEVGALDAVADITAVCLIMHRLAPDQVVASPVHVGSGQVRCAHGILPVPAPATAELLKGIPIYGGEISGELCTPTGAALLAQFATAFGGMPAMTPEAVGYGMGKKDFPRANCLRAIWGHAAETGDKVVELRCNVDDMTGEAMGFALEELRARGALDVFTVPVGMKKSRPGVMLCVLCREEDRERIISLIFRHTTTLGIRETVCQRHTLTRREATVQTPVGPLRRKGSAGYGVHREKYEYEDVARAARERGLSLEEIRRLISQLE